MSWYLLCPRHTRHPLICTAFLFPRAHRGLHECAALAHAGAGCWEILWPDQALRSVKRAVCDCEQGACRQSYRIDTNCPARAMRDLTLSSGKAETLPVCHGMLGLLAGNMPHPQATMPAVLFSRLFPLTPHSDRLLYRWCHGMFSLLEPCFTVHCCALSPCPRYPVPPTPSLLQALGVEPARPAFSTW
jgi:hypothetical protein